MKTLYVAFALSCVASSGAQSPVPFTEAFTTPRMCFDESRQRLMVVRLEGALWEWDGSVWARSVATVPTGRLVYNATRERVFVVGARTYSFDGHSFVDVGSAPAAAWVTTNTQSGDLLIGKASSMGAIQGFEVHRFDGSNWSVAATIPGFRATLSGAFDQARGVLVISVLQFSGITGVETWEWDGTTMSGPLAGPVGTFLPGTLAYDSVRQQVIATNAQGTRAWDGVAWSLLSTSLHPIGVSAMATDVGNRGVWLFDATPGQREGVWRWDGTSWSRAVATPHPEIFEPVVTYDAVRDRAVVLGARTGDPQAPLHAEWTGDAWVTVPAVNGPTTYQHGQVFDAARGETVVFGGGVSVMTSQTWVWNGTNWRVAATSGPSPRRRPAMAFDSVRGRVVLVGGIDINTLLSDHWEWDGSAWTQIAATTPMGAVGGALGFDPLRNRTVFLSTGVTFEYDGVSWQQVATGSPTPSNHYRSMVWNAATQRLQTSAQTQASSLGRVEWDGAQWITVGGAPGALAYDPQRGAMLAYTADGFVIESQAPASAVDFGSPCGGSATATSLTAFGVPRVGSTSFHLDVRAEATQRPALLGFGLGTSNLPIGNGCTFLLQNAIGTQIWFTDPRGFWHQRLALPAALALRGVALHAQAAVLDPASPGGVAMSQGLTLTIGD